MDDRSDSRSENDENRDVSGFRTVVIEQGDTGYGLTVSGENPVSVECVKDGGPAALAGVKKGDALIRVNDRPVSKYNHKDVVHIIKSTHRVKLTLRSKDTDSERSELPLKLSLSSKASGDLITAPVPVDDVLQSQFEGNKVKTLQVFLEKQRKVKENILAELQKNPSKIMQHNLTRELDVVNRQITKITEELNMKESADSQSSSSGSDSSGRNSHQRVRSSPDPLGLQNSPGSNRFSGGEFLGDWSNWGKFTNDDEPPPGTPPPPYGGNSMASVFGSPHTDEASDDSIAQAALKDPSSIGLREPWNNSILPMEEEDCDTSMKHHGPFQSLSKLISMKYNAYVAVFVNYVISNCDPSSLFFYMITGLYKEGGAKEMKKWAYEIHSSFLLPGAPMKLANIDDSVLYEIDETLQTSLDKEEILRKVFWKAKKRSREELNNQLADFRSKRDAGLGSFFGPPDHILDETGNNKCKELTVVEQLLVPILDSVSEDLKNQTERMIVMASSLATLLWKYFGVKSQQSQQLIDRCPLFVNKDRPLRSKILRGSKKQVVRDHHFTLTTFYSVSFCNHCGTVIWGVAPQGYQCSDCEMNVHKWCTRLVEETCVGQVHRNDRMKDSKKLSSLLYKIIPEEKDRNRKGSSVSMNERAARRGIEETDIFGHPFDTDALLGEKSNSSGLSKDQRRSDPGGSGSGGVPGTLVNHLGQTSNGGGEEDFATDDADHSAATTPSNSDNTQNVPIHQRFMDRSRIELLTNNLAKNYNHPRKKSATSINRSESCKEKQNSRKQLRENRKNSDPNIPTSKAGDVDGENLNFHSGSSSSSSLSQSQESASGNITEQIAAYASALDNDSDVEADADLPDWTSRVPQETLEALTSKERKRQETINEFFHTEQSHVRILKVLQFLFHYPLRQGGFVSGELIDSLFPNMDQILRFHTSFNKAMKKRRLEDPLVSCVGDILASMFDGDEGGQFQSAAAEFVACQGFALEGLKQQQKRDQKLAVFLQDQENHPHCRRLQLKDMLPAAFQRLSKYPLLLESLLSYTDRTKQQDEHEKITRALDRSREILAVVNEAVHDAENNKRLTDIQKKLDQSSLAKSKHGNVDDLRGELDLTKHRLIYEGPLTWKTARGQKNIDLHVLILEDCVVLLQKDNDKFILKFHSMNKSAGKDDNKQNLSPIIRYSTFLCREVATDKCGIFILTQASSDAQIYELVASSPIERSMWIRHLHEAQANFNAKEGRHRRSQPQQNLPEPDDSGSPANHITDIDDGVDGEASESADVSVESSGGARLKQEPTELGSPSGAVSSPESVVKKTELLRRKDQKIREALVEKQNLVADILNIPRCDLESVADVAGEAGVVHKEPKELVLAAVFQAKRLQETLNEAQVVTESMVMASRASPDAQPAYRTPFETMQKLLGISSSLNQFLNSLMTIVSERDEERDRMRKELVNSRERLHQLHRNMTQQPSDPDPSGPTDQESSETKVPLAADPCQRVASPSLATARPVTPTPDKAASVSADEEGGKDPVVPVAAPLQSSSDTPLTDKEKRTTGADDGDAATPLLETAEGSSAAGGDEPSGATHPEAETKEAVVTS